MKLSDGTVLPSSFHPANPQVSIGFDNIKKAERLKVGVIVAVRYVDSTEGLQKSASNSSAGVEGTPYETVYDVRIDDYNARPFIWNGCRALKPFMGVNNYFEVIHESAVLSPTYVEQGSPGDVFTSPVSGLVGSKCVVLCLEGNPTAPIILGFMQHPARTSTISESDGLKMDFEFNGINVTIDQDGAFTLTGNTPWIPPITAPLTPVPDPIARINPIAGPFTILLDKDMVFSLSDNMGQMIRVDRSAGEMEITNGIDSMLFSQSESSIIVNVGQEFSITTGVGDTFSVSSKAGIQGSTPASGGTMFSFKNGEVDIESAQAVFVMSAAGNIQLSGNVSTFSVKKFQVDSKVFAFTGATGELLAILKEIFDGIGQLTSASPVGPCGPLQAAPQWAGVVQAALVKLQGLMG